MAAMRFLERLSDHGAPRAITVFGDEPGPAYDRIALSAVLAGERERDHVWIHDEAWYEERGIVLEAGRRIVELDVATRHVVDDRGCRHPYDTLVLATGSLPVLPPIPGTHLDGVLVFRRLCDVEEMIARSRRGGAAVVIGGGLLGLECARGLQQRGMEVTVVHLADRLMERQLDSVGASLLRAELERLGLRILVGTTAAAIEGDRQVRQVRLTTGCVLAADMVVICAGITPNAQLASAAGLAVARGIVVDDRLHTSAPHVYAIGECIEHRGQTFGLVDPVWEQATVLARVIGREERITYQPRLSATALKVAGVDVFAGGRTVATAGDHEVVVRDDVDLVYKKLVLRNEVLVGAALLGDLHTAPLVGSALRTGRTVDDPLRLLGVGTGASPVTGEDLPDTAVVCGCNGVTKAEIVGAIRRPGGCTTPACVTACTRAAGSCGSCRPLVEGLLTLARSPASPPTTMAASVAGALS